jgi:betaine-aldehyde dehydrogenase
MNEKEITCIKPLYINGQWVQGKGKPIMVFDPSTAEPFACVSTASAEDIDDAVSAARAAFPGWSNTSSQDRAKLLRGFAQQMECRRAELLELQSRNNGKPRHEAEVDLNDAIATFCITQTRLIDSMPCREATSNYLPQDILPVCVMIH